jgi:hypothetical protein
MDYEVGKVMVGEVIGDTVVQQQAKGVQHVVRQRSVR